MLESGIALSFGSLVADNENARMIRRVLQGIPVNDITMAVDVIKEMGTNGLYLVNEHTLEHFRAHQSQPVVIDRRIRQRWLDDGARDYAFRAEEYARNILQNHQPAPLPDAVSEKVNAIVEDAEKRLIPKKK
ncbi:hypothetical protein DCMF_25990 [Candidatus Formimonas warabiya]|uniref:Trimethylamine methyltransferase n=1 Tax=Formimonas warabiya TaxID=1761012 RepID=A0A3G1L296_FORW1|nr:hypothetical protein DCMF_25990 [Candidatus Formimonas warabiya]